MNSDIEYVSLGQTLAVLEYQPTSACLPEDSSTDGPFAGTNRPFCLTPRNHIVESNQILVVCAK